MELLLEFKDAIFDAAWIIEIFLLSFSWVILCGKAKKILEWGIHLLGLFMTFGFVNMLLFLIMGGLNNFFISLWGISHGGISAAYLWHYSPYHKKTWVLLWLALYNSILSIAALSGQCSTLFGNHIMRGPIEGVIRCVIYCLMPLTAFYLRRYKFDEFPVVPKSGLFLVGVMCACIQILSLVEGYYFKTGEVVQVVLTFVYFSMFLTSLAAIRAMYTMCKEQKDIMDLQVERQRFLAEREMNRMAESTLEDLKCIRHDIKNQFAYCQILLEEKRYDELREYFSNLKEHMPPQFELTDCGNKTMNTVLNMEFSKFRAKEVEFETKLAVPPTLPFKDADICAIVSNLLDNALEECIRLKEKGRKDAKARLEIYPHQSYLYIRCQNATERKTITLQERGIRTTKADKSVHGYGTRIVAKLAEKYNGCADYSLNNGMFVAQVMMDMTGGEEK